MRPSDRALVFAVLLWSPILVLAAVAKLHRLQASASWGALALLDAIRPEAGLYAALGAVTLASFAVGRAGRWLTASWVALGALAVVLELVGWNFHAATGTYVDAFLLRIAVEKLAEFWVVIVSELHTRKTIAMGLMLVWLAVVFKIGPARPGPMVRYPGRLLLGAFALLALAFPAPAGIPSSSVGRGTVLSVAWSAVRPLGAPDVELDEATSWADARLVPEAPTRWRNVAVVWLESTGQNATSLGGAFDTTPNLAALAEESLVAHDAWAVMDHSTKSTVPMYCAVPPLLTLRVLESESLPMRCLPHMLRDEGYATLMLRSATRHFEGWPGLIANLGFEEFLAMEDLDTEGFERVNYFGVEDDVLLEPARRWLEANGDRPYFVTYMTGTPHHEYQTPSDFPERRLVEDDTHNDYLNAVRYVDRFVGKVLDLHKELGTYEDTIFVFVADHGEAFGEHGRFLHNSVPYQEVTHVPLMVHAPGGFEGGVDVHAPASQLDLAPTVAALLGYRFDAPGRPGRPLWSLDDDRSLGMTCFYDQRCGAWREGPWKLVHHYGDQPDELFHLGRDPGERVDLAGEHPERVARMVAAYRRWEREVGLRYEALGGR